MQHLFTVLIGLVVGSFVNVVVIRLPLKQSLVKPGSSCPHCQRKLLWRDNVPLLSFLILGGKCRFCRGTISARYPLIEFMVATLFLAAELKFGMSPILIIRDWPFLAALVAITFIDIHHRIIPNILSLGGLGLGLLTSFAIPWSSEEGLSSAWAQSFIGAGLGFSLFYGLEWIYERSTGKVGLGGGDVKLLAMLGSYVGPGGVLVTMLVSSLTGSLVGILLAVAGQKNYEMKVILKQSIPFGPFLVIGALYYYLLGDLAWFQFMTQT